MAFCISMRYKAVVCMKIEALVEKLEAFTRDRSILIVGVEELKALGYNVINFTLDLGVDVEYAALSLRYELALDELEPIAVVIQPRRDRLEGLRLDGVLAIVRAYGGYIYGSHKGMGLLIPVREENLCDMLSTAIPNLLKALFGRAIRPSIVGYTLDLLLEERLQFD